MVKLARIIHPFHVRKDPWHGHNFILMFDKPPLVIDMNIEGEPILHFLSFTVKQRFNAHHEFLLCLEQGALGQTGPVDLGRWRQFIGRRIAISFGYTRAEQQNFGGLITDVSLAQDHGYQGIIRISGYSPTILMDRGPDLGSYNETYLYNIVQTASKGIHFKDLECHINPVQKELLTHVIQFQESDFDFINRLSSAYQEWFYYDGAYLIFGKPAELKQLTLTYGREISRLNYALHIAPLKFKRHVYDATADELLKCASSTGTTTNPDLQHAIALSEKKFNKVSFQQATGKISNFSDLKKRVDMAQHADTSRLLSIAGCSDSPKLQIGTELQIDTSLHTDIGKFDKDTLGKFLITEMEHHFDALGRYNNSFSGIIASSDTIPWLHIPKPKPEVQLAHVSANNDPQNLGRVKVVFNWECHYCEETDWLRVLCPNAGSSKTVPANRGFVFIPEIGDQVIIDFENGDIDRPYVLGALFHGQNALGGQSENHLKSIITSSGHSIQFDDSETSLSISIKDKNGNCIQLDTLGKNIVISAPETLSLKAKDILLDAADRVEINATHIKNNALENLTQYSKNMLIAADADFKLHAQKIKEIADLVDIYSQQENMTLYSKKEINTKSASKKIKLS